MLDWCLYLPWSVLLLRALFKNADIQSRGSCAALVQGPVGVSNKHVQTAIDEASGKLTMLYQVSLAMLGHALQNRCSFQAPLQHLALHGGGSIGGLPAGSL